MRKQISPHRVVGLLSVLLLLGVFFLQVRGSMAVDCVGKPYGYPGCPVKRDDGGTKPSCVGGKGNAIIEGDEECDNGRYNGMSNCTLECELLYCGDGIVSPALREGCEPPFQEIYARDEATGELVVVREYTEASCGRVCTVPQCDEEGNCSGGCAWHFLPACGSETGTGQAASASSDSFQAGMKSGTGSASSVASTSSVPPSGPAAPSSAPYVPRCGNGRLDPGEQCDDGDQENFNICTNTCHIAKCGDGFNQTWEQCDDGNGIDADGCSNGCKLPACGDGRVQAGEECDDQNFLDTDSCTNACKLPTCGDRLLHRDAAEECDDGNSVDDDNCTNECRLPRCGDRVIHQRRGEECDDGNSINDDVCTSECHLARCGDGILQGRIGEECDDGNRVASDGCSNLCKLPRCGNGTREGTEQCDDGNQMNEDNCTNECLRPRCGDGFLQSGEQCDDGNPLNDDDCTNTCKLPRCGDGLLQPREQCDDGRDNSDERANACRMSCRKAKCGDRVLDDGEECDGGPTCGLDCKVLKPAAPETPPPSEPGVNPFAVTAAILGLLGSTGFLFRNKLLSLWPMLMGKKTGGGPASIDDVPLDEIEMPWHKW